MARGREIMFSCVFRRISVGREFDLGPNEWV